MNVEDENEQENQETTQVLDDDFDAENTDTVIQEIWDPCTDLPIRFQYSTQNTGIQVNDLNWSNPCKIFRQFLTKIFTKKWTYTNRDKIKKFLGIFMIMGIVPKMVQY